MPRATRFAALLALAAPVLAPTPRADLVSAYSTSGPVDVRILVAAQDSAPAANTTFSLSDVPAGAQIEWARLYTHNWNGAYVMTAAFAGQALPAQGPFQSDPPGSPTAYGSLHAYRWDVTALVGGAGTYAASVSGGSQCYGLALVVVFRHESLPPSQVAVVDGALSVGTIYSSERAQLWVPLLPGMGDLWIYTQADDADTSGEQVAWNGQVVGGPIDAALGFPSSVLRIGPLPFLPTNQLGLVTKGDWFGCHLVVAKGSIASDADASADGAPERPPLAPPANGRPTGIASGPTARTQDPPLRRH